MLYYSSIIAFLETRLNTSSYVNIVYLTLQECLISAEMRHPATYLLLSI